MPQRLKPEAEGARPPIRFAREVVPVLALLPALAMGALAAASSVLPLVGGCVFTGLLLAWPRGQAEDRAGALLSGAAAGLLFSLSLAATTSPLKAVSAFCLGWLLGRALVGRGGHSLVHPAVLGYALLAMTWPDAVVDAAVWHRPALGQGPAAWWALLTTMDNPGALGAASPLAVVVGGGIAVVVGAVRWRPMLGAPIGAALALSLLWRPAFDAGIAVPLWGHVLLGSFPLGAIFLAGLPTTWATHRSSQWICGGLFGFVAVLLRLSLPSHPDGAMSALLLMSIFAPLIDHAVSAARESRTAHD